MTLLVTSAEEATTPTPGWLIVSDDYDVVGYQRRGSHHADSGEATTPTPGKLGCGLGLYRRRIRMGKVRVHR
ncbi:hypothetical protein D8674_030607 [Pyrus ussuriensis x Pyrus communis]|uniref:Uncharacterized protein n=1 Tax=Pyrus ussuriensis x Pyrus communis TaxID=2448454 RepID=A0A5N5EWM7_9ROSA|nr:hypothetical protein D8674_030607 [Pyrus ussuriensis x Pyrus communis]